MKNQIYQLVSFVNAYNRHLKQWDSLRSQTFVYIGKEGLKTAHRVFESEVAQFKNITSTRYRKYSKYRGKVELHIPHIHEDGALAYWGDKIITQHNPFNI